MEFLEIDYKKPARPIGGGGAGLSRAAKLVFDDPGSQWAYRKLTESYDELIVRNVMWPELELIAAKGQPFLGLQNYRAIKQKCKAISDGFGAWKDKHGFN